MARAANMDNPAPDNDASVKSLGIFLLTKVNNKMSHIQDKSIIKGKRKLKLKNRGTHAFLNYSTFIKFTSSVVVFVLIKFKSNNY